MMRRRNNFQNFSYCRTFSPILLQKRTFRQLHRQADRHTLYSKTAGGKKEKEKPGRVIKQNWE